MAFYGHRLGMIFDEFQIFETAVLAEEKGSHVPHLKFVLETYLALQLRIG